MNESKALNYTTYLKINELLDLQQPLSDGPEHDELLFIVIHQTYELWFKELIHELESAQQYLEAGDTHRSLALLGRIRTILKICVAQIDILETMTPLQFNSFRDRLGESSGFQSAQFREIEVILGRRDARVASHLLPRDKERVEARALKPSLWESFLKYVETRKLSSVDRAGSINETLINLHRNDPEASLICERLLDIDEGLQEWRYRHVKMVERTVGAKIGTGGSSGAEYLKQTLFKPNFPELWEIRSSL